MQASDDSGSQDPGQLRASTGIMVWIPCISLLRLRKRSAGHVHQLTYSSLLFLAQASHSPGGNSTMLCYQLTPRCLPRSTGLPMAQPRSSRAVIGCSKLNVKGLAHDRLVQSTVCALFRRQLAAGRVDEDKVSRWATLNNSPSESLVQLFQGFVLLLLAILTAWVSLCLFLVCQVFAHTVYFDFRSFLISDFLHDSYRVCNTHDATIWFPTLC